MPASYAQKDEQTTCYKQAPIFWISFALRHRTARLILPQTYDTHQRLMPCTMICNAPDRIESTGASDVRLAQEQRYRVQDEIEIERKWLFFSGYRTSSIIKLNEGVIKSKNVNTNCRTIRLLIAELNMRIAKTMRLFCCLRAPYSVKNYHKTFEANQVTRFHGHFRVDEQVHFDKDGQAVNSFVKQEQQLYEQQSSKWKHITEEYYQISSSRRDTRLSSVPQRYDDYQYYTKTNWKNGREYVTVHRRKADQEELVLDFMKFPFINRYQKTAQLLSTAFSPSHSRIAFSVDLRNNEKSVYFIAKTTGNRELIKIGDSARSSRLEDAQDLVFASQDKVYFVKVENHRPCRLFSLNISSGQSSELFHEKNEEFYLGLKLSKDKSYLLLSGVSKTGSKLWTIDLESKIERVIKVWQGPGKVYINHLKDYFLIWSLNANSEIRLISDAQVKSLARSKDFIDLSKFSGYLLYTSPEEEIVSDIDLLQDNVVLYGHRVTLPFIKVINYQRNNSSFATKVTDVQMPYQYGTVAPCTNQDYHSSSVLFSVSHPFVYEEIYSYSIHDKTCKLVQKYQHTGNPISTKKYSVQMVEVPATDMETIPLTIIGPTHKRPTKLLLNFYGCYGLPTQITYDNVNIAALEKGWTICYAHIRGGNQRGKKWHNQSQGQYRIRSWLDVEQCVGYLLREEYTHPSLLFLSSSSAGAINLWNTINRKPYLYKGAIFRAPFLDVLTCLLDPDQPLSQTDYEEFGNPLTNVKAYHQISSISPYENIGQIEYPLIHITAGLNDYRTPISQVAKFIARFRGRAVKSRRVQQLGVKGLTVSVSDSGSHLGQASIKQQNYRACDIFGYMDYVIQNCSLDVTASKISS